MDRFESIGIVKNEPEFVEANLDFFLREIGALKAKGAWDKADIVGLFHKMIPSFAHKETGKYLDGRM